MEFYRIQETYSERKFLNDSRTLSRRDQRARYRYRERARSSEPNKRKAISDNENRVRGGPSAGRRGRGSGMCKVVSGVSSGA